MTDIDARFERDLREILDEMAPADAPSRLRDAVASVPYRTTGRRWLFGWTGRTYVALAAAVVVAALVAGVGTGLLRLPGVISNIGGPTVAPADRLRIEYEVLSMDGLEPTQDDVAAVAAVIARRLDATGIVAPSVTTTASGRIVVELAVDPADEATTTTLRHLIGATGRIDFVPLGATPVEAGQPVDLALFPTLFSGDQIASASISEDETGQRTIDLALRPEGTSLFATYTRTHVAEYFALVLDGSALTVPVINGAIENGELKIISGAVGGFPLDQAQALVAIIASGSLPFPIQEVSNNAGPEPSDLLATLPPAPTATASPEPSTTTVTDDALIAAARAYADAIGITLAADGVPDVTDDQPSFDDIRLRLVALPVADRADAALQVYFDISGTIWVVDGAGFSRPTGPDVSRDGALEAAAGQFRLAGVDPSDGTLTVWKGAPGDNWYITLDRVIDGHPVANTPMLWRIAGDRAYVELRSDGTLLGLYAIRPQSDPAPQVLATDVLDERLAIVSGLSADELASLHPAVAWVRAKDPVTGASAPTLSLGYCAAKVRPDAWTGWCVDAGTGLQSVVGGGID